MPGEKKEPQSYGSQSDWVTGNTGGQVNDQKAVPSPQHEDFYDERRESESTHEDQGGKVSPVQAAESALHPQRSSHGDNEQPVGRVSTEDGGAKRDSFFRKRDYQ